MTTTAITRASQRTPPYVFECRRLMDKMQRRQDRVVRRYIPATTTVRTLIRYFRGRLRLEKAILRSDTRRKMEVDWYAKYSPSSYMITMDYEARHRVFAFLIMTLREHASKFSRRPDPAKWHDPQRQASERARFWHAPDALKAVGRWWIEVNRESIRPYVTKKERKAFETCAAVWRLLDKNREMKDFGTSRFTRIFTAYLKWAMGGR